LFQLRDNPSGRRRLAGELSQVRGGFALLQAMLSVWAVHPVSMSEAHTCPHPCQGSGESVRMVLAKSHRGARCFTAPSACRKGQQWKTRPCAAQCNWRTRSVW